MVIVLPGIGGVSGHFCHCLLFVNIKQSNTAALAA